MVLGKLSELGVPSFTFINGLALGGGLEIALNSTYRTVDASAAGIALPEVFLGIIPGWGGAYLLPNLIGIENALEVVISNPLKQNRMLKPQQAFDYGMADAIFPASNFLEDSLTWADGVLRGSTKVERKHEPGKIERLTKWPIAIKMARGMLQSRIGAVPKSPYAALDLLDKARSGGKAEGFAREDDALADLVTGDQFAASMYAFDLVQKRAKRPVGAPDKELAKKVTKVGIIGAGLMASQFALLFLRKLEVPVLITDLDQARVDKGLAYIDDEIGKLEATGRLDGDTANRLRALVTGTTDKSLYADCDFVIEAVFEEVGVKQQVFGEIEAIVAEDAILATNTSSLSVEEIGSTLAHPERLVGFHFFNPVAVMPLIEIVRTPQTTDAALSTAFVVARGLGKNAVLTADAPGFVVNRLLAKVMGEAARAVYEGTPLLTVEKAFAPIGLPMTPFQLIDLVGWKVAAHVQDTMAHAFPDRFFASENFHQLAELPEVVEKDKSGRVTGWSKAAERVLKGAVGSTPATEERDPPTRSGRAGAGDPRDARRGRRARGRGHRPVPHPRRRLALHRRRCFSVPRPGGGLGAGVRRHVPPPAGPRCRRLIEPSAGSARPRGEDGRFRVCELSGQASRMSPVGEPTPVSHSDCGSAGRATGMRVPSTWETTS